MYAMHQYGLLPLHQSRSTSCRGLWLAITLLLSAVAARAQYPSGVAVQQQQVTLRIEGGVAITGPMWTVTRDATTLGKVYDSRRRFTEMPGQFDPENNRGDKPVLPFETLEDAIDWLLADYTLQLQQNLDSLLLFTDTTWITRTDTALKLRYSVPADWIIAGRHFFPDLTGHPDSTGRRVADLTYAKMDSVVYNTIVFSHRHHNEVMLMLYMYPLAGPITLEQAADAVSATIKTLGTKTLRSEAVTMAGRSWRKLYLMDFTGKQPAYLTIHQGRLYLVQGGAYLSQQTQAAIDAVASHVLAKLLLL